MLNAKKIILAALAAASLVGPAQAARYALVDARGNVVNVIEWDGTSAWTAPSGMAPVLDTTGRVDQSWTYKNGAFVPPPPPPPPILTPDKQIARALAAGLQVASTSTAAINATYATDATTQQRLAAISLYVQVNGRFPAGQAQLPWPDAAGTPHVFPTTSQFQAFATAVGDFVTATSLGQTPAQPVVIP